MERARASPPPPSWSGVVVVGEPLEMAGLSCIFLSFVVVVVVVALSNFWTWRKGFKIVSP